MLRSMTPVNERPIDIARVYECIRVNFPTKQNARNSPSAEEQKRNINENVLSDSCSETGL